MKKLSFIGTGVLFIGLVFFAKNVFLRTHAAGNYTVETNATINNAEIKIKAATGDLPTQITSASLDYQKQGDLTWTKGLDPSIVVGNTYADQPGVGDWLDSSGNLDTGDLQVVSTDIAPMIHRVYGSIFYLSPSTTYNIRVTLLQADGSTYDTVTASVTTEPDAVSYGTGKTLNVGAGQTYSTINAAYTAAAAGDTIVVQPGTYNEAISVTKSGAQGNPITFRGLSGAIMGTPSSASASFSFNTDNVHDIIVEGFNMTCSSSCRKNLIAASGKNLQRLTIQNNTFSIPATAPASTAPVIAFLTNGYNQGVLQNISDLTFQNNTFNIQNIVSSQFFMNDGKNVIIRNNNFAGAPTTDNTFSLCEGPHENIDVYNNTITAPAKGDFMEIGKGIDINVRVYENTLDNSAGGLETISTTPSVVGPVYVFRNTIYAGPQVDKVASNVVVDVYSKNSSDPQAYGHTLASLAPIYYYQNTIYAQTFTAGASDPQMFLRYETNLCHSNFILRNNIIVNRNMTSSAGQNTKLAQTDQHWGQIDSDHNLWWNGSTTNANASYGLDLHSIFADPQFTNTNWPNPDLTLKSTSPAIDKGIVIPNINDNFSGSAPDLGRYEYGTTPQLTLTKTVDKTQAQSGDTLTYTITYQNQTSDQLTNTSISDAIPANTNYVTSSVSASGTYDGSSKVTWNLGTLSPGASGSVSFKVTIK
ncbi:MAG: DUF11 domain-containing protein [Patescibacteria group bacterium]|jgi:uncharacterized repeat protein (TIGR01451 family)